jgi:predicted SnoaL-like aldol condensation-catalyzing enzyme
MRYEHQLAVAEGDYVMIHGRFSHIGQAANWIVVDICRLQGGVLVEHWDVIQDEVGKQLRLAAIPCLAGPSLP